ncbi:uncharacterized protein LOC121388987 [Gigantopelta aegis]|uniref:uncharacterized protein LOC121388987 n=1 Tax=Gigantopelta aegis TaxID=1735272 RepID=UPI001B88B1B7|nr:uncharacterized protein LOC121388987 [Gigantopelta aegis]
MGDYRANHCHETSHCIPCWVRYASCLDRVDGLNPWPDLEWKPFFVECYRERTVFQGVCDKSAVFSPLTRACETPYSIPRQNGGWRPSCEERRDGVYPDEYGRCDIYYVCKGEIFTGFFRCERPEIFNPISGECDNPEKVPYPCGDLELPNVCQEKNDGYYLDIFGRCTHYMECKSGELAGVSMCPSGVFNPESRRCDLSQNVIKPCGNLSNPCVFKDDGFFANREKDCIEYFQCERGFMVAKFKCPENTVYNDVTNKCDDVSNTPPPCGIAPECEDKEDGFYPALNKGMQFYYECKNNTFVMYKQCEEDHGGLVFSPTQRNCDFPKQLCLDLHLGPEIC